MLISLTVIKIQQTLIIEVIESESESNMKATRSFNNFFSVLWRKAPNARKVAIKERGSQNFLRFFFHSQKNSLTQTQIQSVLTHKRCLTFQGHYNFCSNKTPNSKVESVKPEQIPQENLVVAHSHENIQGQEIEITHSKGTISINDSIPGVKDTNNGDLFALSFTCGPCGSRQIKTFTKHAYKNGVVLVRCEGCEKIHLVADNLGWFEDQPVNVETLHEGKVKKVHDPLVISQFMEKAFGKGKEMLEHPDRVFEDEQESKK